MDTIVDWRPVAGFLDYEVSNTGQVRRVHPFKQHPAGKILKPKINVDGYRVVALYRDRRSRHLRIARLVALAFIGEPPTPLHVAAHWDGDKLNDSVENLRWATAAENEMDKARQGVRNDPYGESHHASVLTEDAVRGMRCDRLSGMCVPDIASKYVVSKMTAYDAIVGKTWAHITNPPGVPGPRMRSLEAA